MRLKDENKRKAIRNAAVAEVIEGGLAGASVGKIAKRAGVSAGTIYLYFPNKDELLQQIYLEIKTELHDHMMSVFDGSKNSSTNIRNMWFSLFEYALEHANDFIFSEYASATQLLDEARKPAVEAMAVEIGQILNTAIKDGTLRQVPIGALNAILIAPAIQLGRHAIMAKGAFDRQIVKETFDMIWKGIASD
ncbi:MAG: TetR/AcrR family transcriptional regulator [Sneathiella sp.]